MLANKPGSPQIVVAFAWLTHVVSWFLPVLKPGGWHSEVLGPIRGWFAFRVALSPVWPYEDFHMDHWYHSVLSVVSAATILFMVVSPWVVYRGSRGVQKACAWIFSAAFIVNSHWYILFGSDRKELSVGYFLWWLSFILLAIGLFGLARDREVNDMPAGHGHLESNC